MMLLAKDLLVSAVMCESGFLNEARQSVQTWMDPSLPWSDLFHSLYFVNTLRDIHA